MVNLERYQEQFEKILRSIYLQEAGGIQPSPKDIGRFEGFTAAATALGVVPRELQQQWIDKLHRQVFGCDREERVNRHLMSKNKGADYNEYDEPTYLRKGRYFAL